MEIRNLELQREQLNSQLKESKSISELERDRPSTAAMDSKGWKSAVVTRMYEGKLKDLEKELEKKVRDAHIVTVKFCVLECQNS